MNMAEAMALVTLGAGVLPALSNRGGWIAGLTVIGAVIMGASTWFCLEASQGLAGLLCIFALTAGCILGLASIALGLVRWRYRHHGAETLLGRPWFAGLLLYGLAALGFSGFIWFISG